MAIKLSFNNAKRLGFSIKGYVFYKGKNTPQPIFEKATKKTKKKREKKEYLELKDEGSIVKLKLN